jgi:hypothetical protein
LALIFASNATAGVILAADAILAIIARINLAGRHHREMMAALTTARPLMTVPVSRATFWTGTT